MSVMIPIPIDSVEQERERPSRTYRLDFNTGRITGMVDGLDAVNQAIRKALLTPRFRCLIYDNQYGGEIKAAILADNASPEFISTDLPRSIKDTLSVDSRILDVYDIEMHCEDDQVWIWCTVDTIFGKTQIKEVI